MKQPESGPDTRIFRADYQPPAWRVDEVQLAFDLTAAADAAGQHPVRVDCRQTLESVSGTPGPLRLDGRDMRLLEIRVNGEALADSAYELDAQGLTIPACPAQATLEIRGEIQPFANASLEGLYGSAGLLCTQCEAHGFSRITWFLDRPDVLARYRVEITAPVERYPVLLANGNRVLSEREGDVLRVVWEDPHPKPSYLFALVAGKLVCVRDQHRTPSGRDVAIEFWCDPGLEQQLGHAVASLKQAMRFDEQVYQREYDLDLYMVVVARAFNMGAMENKGLNIFNPKCVLAHPQTATDEDHVHVEAVVAHEYLHNWTGNRITCRDWFQLSLKEGLTVYREQEFSALHAGGPAQRIHEVALLQSRQFVEDAGPLAHPVRPASYVDMNNFYTATVYEKGAELVRVLATLVGAETYAAGMQRYFSEFDGQAASLEDFLGCFVSPAQPNLVESMLRWYDQAGTPTVHWQVQQPAVDQVHLHWTQSPPAVADAAAWRPVPIPLQVEFVDAQGSIPLADAASAAVLLDATEQSQTWTLARPVQGTLSVVPSGGFPAPVRHQLARSETDLQHILRAAQDPCARWEAAQQMGRQAVASVLAGQPLADATLQVYAELLQSDVDPAVLAELLTLPSPAVLLAEGQEVDPLALTAAWEVVETALSRVLWDSAQDPAQRWAVPPTWAFTPAHVGQRKLALRLLATGLRAGVKAAVEQACQWVQSADNLSLRLGALQALWAADDARKEAMLEDFRQRHAADTLVLDRAFALRARFAAPATLEAMLREPEYVRTAPNRVRAVLDTLARHNLAAFYAQDGRALRAWCSEMALLDGINPQLTARLLGALETVPRLANPWRSQLLEAMQELRRRVRAPAVHEQLGRLLNPG